jgi:c-di-GMP-binding flagellar brake protein YcgR
VRFLVDGYVAAHGELADVSLDGASLWMGGGFHSGDTFELHFDCDDPAARSFRTMARVVWCRHALSADGRTRCGVRWDHIASAEQDQLQQFIATTCARL